MWQVGWRWRECLEERINSSRCFFFYSAQEAIHLFQGGIGGWGEPFVSGDGAETWPNWAMADPEEVAVEADVPKKDILVIVVMVVMAIVMMMTIRCLLACSPLLGLKHKKIVKRQFGSCKKPRYCAPSKIVRNSSLCLHLYLASNHVMTRSGFQEARRKVSSSRQRQLLPSVQSGKIHVDPIEIAAD